MADKNKPLVRNEPKALVIHNVVVPRNEGTLCDCRNKPYWQDVCEDCKEGEWFDYL